MFILPNKDSPSLDQFCKVLSIFCIRGRRFSVIMFFRPGVSLMPKYTTPEGSHLNCQFFLIFGGHNLDRGIASDFPQFILYPEIKEKESINAKI